MNARDARIRDTAIRDIGCICCWMVVRRFMPATKHHLLTTGLHGNGKRIGEQATLGLCPYHHQGYSQSGWHHLSREEVLRRFGPSYADHAREFRRVFGSDTELLAYQDGLIEKWHSTLVSGADL